MITTAASAPLDHPSEIMPLAVRSLVLDVERVGERLIAVGERGHILIRDGGRSFTQVVAPVRSTLTALTSGPVDRPVFAVGHDGVILKSDDRGASWQLVFSSPEDPRPLLDVARIDGRTVVAVGAFGWLVRSEDDGATWRERAIDETEPHLNGVAEGSDGKILVAAEFGLVYLSEDAGKTFSRQELPYEGSFFGALRIDGAWLAFGLRGRVFRRDDGQAEWRRVEVPSEATLLTGLRLESGTVLLGGLEGTLLASEDGQHFQLLRDPERRAITALAELGDGSLLLAGEGGLRWMSDPLDPSSIVPVAAPAP